jgi:hypothetical protein
MITFSEVVLRPLKEKDRGLNRFQVVHDVEVRLNGSFLCVIEAGFVSDGASIPKLLRARYASWGKYAGSALLHDHLLVTSPHPKWLIDWLFYGALRAEGVPALEAAIFWLAVRFKR